MLGVRTDLRKVAAGAACLAEREEAVIAVESRDHAKNNGVIPKVQTSRGNTMRVFLILIAIIGFGISVKAQDIITLKNGTDIQALVQEVGEVDVKYKKFENPNGPNYTLKKTEILIIRYANGSKDIFSEEEKPIEKKEVSQSKPNPTDTKKTSISQSNNENMQIVYLPANTQSRKDVIVLKYVFVGLQTEIMNTDYKYIYYKKYKRGVEQVAKIKKKNVAWTLTFNDEAKKEKYPEEINLQEFLSLPVVAGFGVFGAGKSNFIELRKTHPNICNDYLKAQRLMKIGSTFNIFVAIPPFGIPGAICLRTGISKAKKAITNYYGTCVDLNVCEKYGIIITPYSVNPFMY